MFSVGVLYSSQELLELVRDETITEKDFLDSFGRFKVASADAVFRQCIDCKWLTVEINGRLKVTEWGTAILSISGSELRLRQQLIHLIDTLYPRWAGRIRYGRGELQFAIPSDVRQCFDEAGVMGAWSDELVEWWDRLAASIRLRKSEEALETGRHAERLSVNHELARLGRSPLWQALDTAVAGYDILSTVSSQDSTPLCIEVKGTLLRKNEAQFFVTRNEWDTAQKSAQYVFDLWLLRGEPKLRRVEARSVLSHIPSDNGNGQWKQTAVPFKAFF